MTTTPSEPVADPTVLPSLEPDQSRPSADPSLPGEADPSDPLTPDGASGDVAAPPD
ncbi:MAG: hypothetical protein ACR2KL_09115 [Nocardioidaceae bacterium]